MLRMLRRTQIAMKILLRMKRASLKNPMSIIAIQQAPTTEPIQVTIILSSMITKARPEPENRLLTLGAQRRIQQAEGIALIKLERYKTFFASLKKFFCRFFAI